MIASISRKLASGVGFSNGCALLTPYQPPPFVNSCLQDSKDATGPSGMLCVSTFWSTITGLPLSSLIVLPFASVLGTCVVYGSRSLASGYAFQVCGQPCHINGIAQNTDSGKTM